MRPSDYWFAIPVLTLVAFVVGDHALRGDDWPQYRGPRRDDVSAEKGLLQEWPAGGPALAWTYSEAGIGYSGMAVVGNRLFTIGGRDQDEKLIAVDIGTVRDGAVKEAWSLRVGETFDFSSNKWSAGPSSTTTGPASRSVNLRVSWGRPGSSGK